MLFILLQITGKVSFKIIRKVLHDIIHIEFKKFIRELTTLKISHYCQNENSNN